MLFPRYMYKGNEWISVSHSCLISEMIWNKLNQVRESIKACPHYENIPIQIYWKFYHRKIENFQTKNSSIFHISAQNIDCGYLLEPPLRGGSNEYHNLCFWAEISKIMYTPLNPRFTI